MLLQVLRENGAVGVDIATHVMIPNGLAQVSTYSSYSCKCPVTCKANDHVMERWPRPRCPS